MPLLSFSAVFTSQKRRRRDVSLAEDPIAVAEEERIEELKGDDMDIPEVCFHCVNHDCITTGGCILEWL